MRQQQQQQQQLEQTQRESAEARLARLARLPDQIQPHFLINTLNLINAVMYEDAARADRLQ